jgi:hypothetical protein
MLRSQRGELLARGTRELHLIAGHGAACP